MLLASNLISYLKEHPSSQLNYIFSAVIRLFSGVRVKGRRNNTIRLANTYARNLRITIEGDNNIIDFSEGANYIQNSKIYIHGNGNRIILGKRNFFDGADLYIEDNGNLISFGDHNRLFGKTHVACIEGTECTFKNGCLFSDHVVLRTGDSHCILDVESNERINPSKSIRIGNRVWFGNTVTVLKGVMVHDDSIIGTGAIVTSDVPSNSIVAGVPARVVKSGVKWELHRSNQ